MSIIRDAVHEVEIPFVLVVHFDTEINADGFLTKAEALGLMCRRMLNATVLVCVATRTDKGKVKGLESLPGILKARTQKPTDSFFSLKRQNGDPRWNERMPLFPAHPTSIPHLLATILVDAESAAMVIQRWQFSDEPTRTLEGIVRFARRGREGEWTEASGTMVLLSLGDLVEINNGPLGLLQYRFVMF